MNKGDAHHSAKNMPSGLWQLSSETELAPHWSCESETYAPASVLIGYLGADWIPDNPVTAESFYYGSCRHSEVYHFVLRRRNQSIELPVVANPIVFRVVAKYRLDIQRGNTEHHAGEAVSRKEK